MAENPGAFLHYAAGERRVQTREENIYVFIIQNTLCPAAVQSQVSVHAHKHTHSAQTVRCFLHCKSFSAPDKDVVWSKSTYTPHIQIISPNI